MRNLLILIFFLLLVAGVFLLLVRQPTEWSTDSSEALLEFERGLDARMKMYNDEAGAHFARALELDPDFVAAKLVYRGCCVDSETRHQMTEELRRAEKENLTARERFMLEYDLADADQQWDERDQLLEEYLGKHPKDPFALWMWASDAWNDADLTEAEQRYRRLLEVDPNWVQAQNRLGYIAMALGRFAEAEQLFETYNYLAPDQANPHDSLGELLTLVGRYPEARKELEKALAIKPDFCASYRHLLLVGILDGSIDHADGVLERAAEHCDKAEVAEMRCQADLWSDFFECNFAGPWQEDRLECNKVTGDFSFIHHRMELLTGRREEALAREERIRQEIEKHEQELGRTLAFPRGFLHYLEGARLAIERDYTAAAARFDEADVNLLYWFEGQGILKLYNRLHLAYALEKAGHDDESRQVLAKVEVVNPELARAFPAIKGVLGEGCHPE